MIGYFPLGWMWDAMHCSVDELERLLQRVVIFSPNIVGVCGICLRPNNGVVSTFLWSNICRGV